jgi:hypothetical protein
VHVTTDQDCEFAREGREWVFTTRVTVRMSAAERWQMDGVRVEAFPWARFRLKLSPQPPGAESGFGGWRYEVRDTRWTDDDTGEHPVVRSGTRPTWDAAREEGRFALGVARLAALDEDQPGPFNVPATGAGK